MDNNNHWYRTIKDNILLKLTPNQCQMYQVCLNSTILMRYESIKTIRAHHLKSTTICLGMEMQCILSPIWLYLTTSGYPLYYFNPCASVPSVDALRTIRLVKHLVNAFAKFLSTYAKELTPCFSICFIALCLMWTCPFFPLYTLLCATLMTFCESQWRK